ncbi:GNAT family N-acetyltransferase [Bacillus sp. DTU_2020_1000418_1_SI_GHA_SEK_038]|uniref:GNAT family N-acetyltransferase n=1 Tax=Bacillus sp. DTU_2020_1000418_1_SI_GHA_SEK_038 TaxID=3077585 RepID=UPI0028EA11B4|nr:GNAT family N-acetyltransferase [Bacillus sp. DTU_2020_1000418_1_SI_GHA_SEK_038]WNS76343.1 GNAT family N-acetyltransferase [Bacillus sp. DTU_2020_1000418_1_SI_GHA_SEK_038]
MNIRLLNPSDAEAYQYLRLIALKNHPSAFASSYEEEKDRPSVVYGERFQSGDSFTFGAFEGDALIGSVTLFIESKMKLNHRANIFAMYVSPEKRKMGIGKQLISAAIEKAKELNEIEQIYLTVEATNEAAKKLYHSFGFETFGRDKRALKIGDLYFDEEHMVLYL